MNALVTLNLNDFMPSQVRDSFMYAARCWGCQYVEITQPLGPMHHFWQKAMIPLSIYTMPFKQVLQLDCDMLVRSDCPNPFDIVSAEKVGVVSRVQPNRPKWTRRASVGQLTANALGLPLYHHAEEHLNAGFILYNPTAHKALLAVWHQVGQQHGWPVLPFPEQTALSCLLSQQPNLAMWLPWEFNACTVRKRFPAGPMQAYIYHLHRPRPGGLAQYAKRYQWNLNQKS